MCHQGCKQLFLRWEGLMTGIYYEDACMHPGRYSNYRCERQFARWNGSVLRGTTSRGRDVLFILETVYYFYFMTIIYCYNQNLNFLDTLVLGLFFSFFCEVGCDRMRCLLILPFQKDWRRPVMYDNSSSSRALNELPVYMILSTKAGIYLDWWPIRVPLRGGGAEGPRGSPPLTHSTAYESSIYLLWAISVLFLGWSNIDRLIPLRSPRGKTALAVNLYSTFTRTIILDDNLFNK